MQAQWRRATANLLSTHSAHPLHAFLTPRLSSRTPSLAWRHFPSRDAISFNAFRCSRGVRASFLVSAATVAAAVPIVTQPTPPFADQPISETDSPLFPFTFASRDTDLTVPLPALRYPVVLVHGYLGYASLIRDPLTGDPLLEYFGSVRTHLAESSEHGITVITPVNPPAASIAARAKSLQIALGMKKSGVEEKPVDGDSEHTQRQVKSTETATKSHSHLKSDVPMEFRDTGGDLERQRAATEAPAADRAVSITPQTGSVKTASDVSQERAAEVLSAKSSGASLILGGRAIDLDAYEGKFHLVAHSMGGLDCRYLISHLQGADAGADGNVASGAGVNRVASLTTIASPHRGSPIADRVLDVLDVPFAWSPDPARLAAAPTINKFFQWFAGLCGIDASGINNLATAPMHGFNERVRDHPHVTYFSYGGARRFAWSSIWYWPSRWIAEAEQMQYANDRLAAASRPDATAAVAPPPIPLEVGANDGMVSVTSARWGTYCGTTGLDHLEQIGLGVWNKHLPLYRQIVFRLHELEQAEEAASSQIQGNSSDAPNASIHVPSRDQ